MTTGLVSVLIPAKNELFLKKTIEDLLAKATGPLEVIPVLDGYWINPDEFVNDKRVVYVHLGQSGGMRNAINIAARIARGEFLLKSDAHCMFQPGFDEILKAGVPEYTERTGSDAWMVIPRRNRLDAEKWELQDVGKPPVDYEYLSSPADAGVKGNVWTQRAVDRANDPRFDIDENMSFQGSCYFTPRTHYLDRLGGMSEVGYGSFVREAQEIGLKTWLGGGKIFTNKKVWYAHLHKGKTYGRMYFLNAKEVDAGNRYCDDYWFNNRWEGAKYDLAWLIERFMPVPTWTPELIDQVRRK